MFTIEEVLFGMSMILASFLIATIGIAHIIDFIKENKKGRR